MWWKKNKWKIIVPVLIAAVLAVAFSPAKRAGEPRPGPGV
jgi:predicted PurR-regulated permease PerM